MVMLVQKPLRYLCCVDYFSPFILFTPKPLQMSLAVLTFSVVYFIFWRSCLTSTVSLMETHLTEIKDHQSIQSFGLLLVSFGAFCRFSVRSRASLSSEFVSCLMFYLFASSTENVCSKRWLHQERFLGKLYGCTCVGSVFVSQR